MNDDKISIILIDNLEEMQFKASYKLAFLMTLMKRKKPQSEVF
jgi:hypothetical protein